MHNYLNSEIRSYSNFLLENVKLNKCNDIPFIRTGWDDKKTDLGTFDTIIGSDILYERGHAEVLSKFIDQHAKPQCEIIIIDPGRKNHARFSKNMVKLGYSHSQSKPENTDTLTQPFRDSMQFQTLHYQR